MKISLTKELDGRILDLGGGGEGIIARVYGDSVTAIDKSRAELDEAPDIGTKLVMDARRLDFAPSSFDHVTCFYSLMYMPKAVWPEVFAEACRVLRPHGTLQIWDATIRNAYPEPFLAELEIDCAGTPVRTTYGVIDPDGAQDAADVINHAGAAGFRLQERIEQAGHFRLRFLKSAAEGNQHA